MRRQIFIIIFLLVIFPIANIFTVQAQESTPSATPTQIISDFNQAYQNYLSTYNQYQAKYKEYIVAKNQYEAYKTLTSKTIALEQTTAMLQARDEVITTFLTTLRIKMADETQISSNQINALYLKLDDEITWFEEHKDTLTSAGSIPDLMNISLQAEQRYSQTQRYIYQSILAIFIYQEALLQDSILAQINQTEAKINQIRTEGKKDTSTIERWLLEAKNKKTRSGEKFTEAKSVEFKDNLSALELSRYYNRVISLLEQAHQYLKETNINLIELVKEIKRGD